MCKKCLGTGMFDVISSIPCDCINKKKTLNRIIRAKERALEENRYCDASDLNDLEEKIKEEINDK